MDQLHHSFVLTVSDYSPCNDKCPFQPEIHFSTDNQWKVLNVAGELHMSLFPLFEEFHFGYFWQNSVGQAPDQHQTTDAHVLRQVISDCGFINFHKQSEDILKNN